MACFIGFCSVVYKQFGGMIHDSLAADGKRILAEHNAKEDAIIQDLQDKLADINAQSNIVQDAMDIKNLRLATYDKLSVVGAMKPLHDYKSQMERVLTMIEVEELASKEKMKQELMAEATSAVQSQFLSVKTLQQTALTNAIATLKGGASPATDPVQQAYQQFFQQKAKALAATSAQQEAAEIAQQRAVVIAKINAVAKNDHFYFQLDPSTGQPRMNQA
jgi:Mitochondrial ATP synthase B chain precursor (ATP-synt_B)